MSDAATSGSSERSARQRWAEAVAGQFAGRAEPAPRGIRLDVEGPAWTARGLPSSLVLADAPASPEQWTLRFRVFEQMAARALASSPSFFSLQIDEPDGSTHDSQEVRVLRLALGVVRSSSPFALARWTGYSIAPLGWTAVLPAADALFAPRGPDELWQEGAAPDPAELQPALERLAGAITTACGPELQPADREASQEALGREIRELDFLYFQPDERLPTLRGVAPEGVSLDHAIAAEHRARLGALVERYTAVVQVRVLSLGWIRCRAVRELAAGKKEVRLPFVTLRVPPRSPVPPARRQ